MELGRETRCNYYLYSTLIIKIYLLRFLNVLYVFIILCVYFYGLVGIELEKRFVSITRI